MIKKYKFSNLKNLKKNIKNLFFVIVKGDYLICCIDNSFNENYFYAIESNHILERNIRYKDKIDKIKNFIKEYRNNLQELKKILDKNALKIDKTFFYRYIDKPYVQDFYLLNKFKKVLIGEGNKKIDIFGFNKNGTIKVKFFLEDDKELLEHIRKYYEINGNLKWYKNEYMLLPLKKINIDKGEISFNVIKGEVLDAKEVYRGFISAKDLVKNLTICKEDKGFQRKLYDRHVEEIIEFLKGRNYKYKYFPEITIALYKNENVKLKNILDDLYQININSNMLKHNCDDKIVKYEDIWKKRNFYIIDGRHRLSALKRLFEEKDEVDYILPITLILVKNEDEYNALSYFYYINQKQKTLIAEDYVNLVNAFRQNQEFVLDWNVVDVILFNDIVNKIKENKLFSELEDVVLSINILQFIKYLKEEEKLFGIFENWYRKFTKENDFIEKFIKYIGLILGYYSVDKEKIIMAIIQGCKKEDNVLEKFIDGLDVSEFKKVYNDSIFQKIINNRLENKLYVLMYLILYYTNEVLLKIKKNLKIDRNKKDFNNVDIDEYIEFYKEFDFGFEDIIKNEIIGKVKFFIKYRELSDYLEKPLSIVKVIENLYAENSRIIFYSSKFAKKYERNYYIVKDVISEIEKEFDMKIYFIRLDKPNKVLSSESFNIPSVIIDLIKKSGLLIADISGNSANVYHEIGIKMGMDSATNKKPNLIIIKDKDEKFQIPFNISHLQYIEFDSDIFLKTHLKEKLYKYFLPINGWENAML